MAGISYKAVAIANALLSELNFRGPLAFTLSQAADGNPVLTTGSGTAGAQNIVIKVQNYLAAQNAAAVLASKPMPYVDELGLAANAFSPTQVLISVETSTAANISLVLTKNLAPVLATSALFGTDVQLLMTANGTAPTAGAGTVATDFHGQVQYPAVGEN